MFGEVDACALILTVLTIERNLIWYYFNLALFLRSLIEKNLKFFNPGICDLKKYLAGLFIKNFTGKQVNIAVRLQ